MYLVLISSFRYMPTRVTSRQRYY